MATRSQRINKRKQEKALVRRMIRGDEDAFETFCDDYLPALHRFAQRRLDGNRELTRDIVQSTVAKALPKLYTFRGDAALLTWLCACCRSEIAGHFRRRGNGLEVELREDPVPVKAGWNAEPEIGPENQFLRGEKSELVHAALDQLPAHYARVLEWKYLDELPVDEISHRLEMKLKAAESLLTRARNSFREVYVQLLSSPHGVES